MRQTRYPLFVLSLSLCGCADAPAAPRQDGRSAELGGRREAGPDGSGRREAAARDTPSSTFLACHQKPFPISLDRSCTQASDCFAALHMKDCCGTHVAVGLNVKEKQAFATAEKECAATFPGCGCPTGPTEVQDGSKLAWGEEAGVTCQGGTCVTFVKGCGGPCPTGRLCHQCTVKTTRYAVCSTTCVADVDCKDATLAKCELSETFEKFCTANVGCGTK